MLAPDLVLTEPDGDGVRGAAPPPPPRAPGPLRPLQPHTLKLGGSGEVQQLLAPALLQRPQHQHQHWVVHHAYHRFTVVEDALVALVHVQNALVHVENALVPGLACHVPGQHSCHQQLCPGRRPHCDCS